MERRHRGKTGFAFYDNATCEPISEKLRLGPSGNAMLWTTLQKRKRRIRYGVTKNKP